MEVHQRQHLGHLRALTRPRRDDRGPEPAPLPGRFVHPLVGPLTLDCQILTSENLTERLVVFTASAGSEVADRLKLLSVLGSQEFPAPSR